MAWKDQHPNWLAKARALGWDRATIQKVRQGGTPGPRKLEQFGQVGMRNGQAVYINDGKKNMTPPGAPVDPGSGPAAPGMPEGGESAFAYLKQQLDGYGLGSLSNVLRQLILDGTTDANQLSLALQSTNEWKQRFAGNEALRQQGLPVLSIGEYISAERSYAQALKQYGLPQGFYDDPSDFAKWIGNSVSPNEVSQRAQMWADIANRQDPAVKQQLASMGMTDGDLIAFMMDPGRATPLIQKKYQSTLIGAAARRSGVVADNLYVEKLAGMGVTEQQAQQGYGFISENLGALQTLAQVHGVDYDQGDAEAEVFEGSGASAKKRKRLASQERAAFGGQSGVVKGSLTQNNAGSY